MTVTDTDTLFRTQALHAQRRRLWGEMLLTQPPGTRVFVLLLLLAAAGAGALLYLAEFTRTERVSGYLVPEGGVALIEAPQSGVVAHLAVTEGAQVAAGDLLLRIQDPRENGAAWSAGELLLETLHAALERNETAWQAEQRRLELEQDSVRAGLERVRARHRILQAQLDLVTAETALAERHWQRVQRLQVSQHASREQVDAGERAWLQLRERRQALTARKLELNEERARLQERQAALPLQHAIRQAEYQDERGRLQRERVETGVRWRFELRAPYAGRIAAVNVEPGDPVAPGRTLLTLLSPDAQMQAILLVPSRAAGFIDVGQSVRMRYDAFPHARFGSHPGTVSRVGRSVLAPNQLQPPARADEPIYKVRVALERDTLDAYGKPMPLQAGMALEADVVLERRPLWTWLLEPVLALRGRLS